MINCILLCVLLALIAFIATEVGLSQFFKTNIDKAHMKGNVVLWWSLNTMYFMFALLVRNLFHFEYYLI